MDANDLAVQLNKVLIQSERWLNPRIDNLVHVASGWESEIFAFDLYADGSASFDRLVVRIYPGLNASEKAVLEYNALGELHAAGYPVPPPVYLELKHLLYGNPFMLMQYIPGERIWSLFNRLERGQILQLLEQIARLQAKLHQLNWRKFTDERPTNPYFWLDRWLAQMEWGVEQFNLTSFQSALSWLQEGRSTAPCYHPAAIHWDFHPDNVLLCPDGSLVVVDWTQFQVSDPRFDLAWSLLLIGSYEDNKMSTAYLNSYQNAAEQSLQALDYFHAAVIFKRLGSVYISLSQNPEDMGMRTGSVESMRSHFPVFRRMYTQWSEYTQVPIPAIENMLSE